MADGDNEDDKCGMYLQIPKVIEKDGLVKILIDTNGTNFNADEYIDGFKMTIDFPYDYPPEMKKGLRVIDYRVYVDDFGRKSWREIGRRQWAHDLEHPKISFYGKWEDRWS